MKTNHGKSASHGKGIHEERYTKGTRTRSRRWVRPVVIVLVIILAAAGSAGLYYNHLLNQISYVEPHEESFDPNLRPGDLTDPVETTRFTPKPTQPGETTSTTEAPTDWVALYEEAANIPVLSDPDVLNIALIGNDADGSTYYSRADTIIIVSIDKKSKTLKMASILRDNGVLIPGRTDGIDKINHAYSYGGPWLLLDTIEANFKVAIDNYISVGFTGFDKIVDAVGGLDINLTQAEADWLGLEPGINHLDGHWTQKYARIRKIDSDFQRTSRQRYVLELIAAKARSMDILQLTNLLEEILPWVSTGLTRGELSSLLLKAPAMLNYPMTSATVPLVGSYISIDYTFHLDLIANIEHLQTFLYGRTTT